jgi:hypothetical protein
MNYLFLNSFLWKKERSCNGGCQSELEQSEYLDYEAGKCAHASLSSLTWWDQLKRVIDFVQPSYAFLWFADQKRNPNFSDVLLEYLILRHEYDALFHDDRTSFNEYMKIVEYKMHDVSNATYMN